ncbi:MAG: phosphatase PAP2 family protein [Bacteroidetes bacterium]|nr:phosphatase PAP2 family protein [Bacteroidota bacterium]
MMAGFFYLTWVSVSFLFSFYLFVKNRRQLFYFSVSFLLLNLIGFIIYYAYPAAPPWYVRQQGFHFFPATTSSSTGFSKFAHYFKMGIFKSIYAQSSNVFAAMPSLHSASPMVVLYFGLKNKLGLINVLFALIMGGFWFSAIYKGHHYILDVLVGIACAVLGIFLFNYILLRSERVRRLIGKMISATT